MAKIDRAKIKNFPNDPPVFIAKHVMGVTIARPEAWITFISRVVGHNWVIARRTSRVIAQYGEDVVCLSQTRYKSLQEHYRDETKCDPLTGRPDPELLIADLWKCLETAAEDHPIRGTDFFALRDRVKEFQNV